MSQYRNVSRQYGHIVGFLFSSLPYSSIAKTSSMVRANYPRPKAKQAMITRTILIWSLSILLAQNAMGTVRMHPPFREVTQVGISIESFYRTNGRYPSEWAELDPMFSIPLDDLFKSISPVTKRFQLIAQQAKPIIPTTSYKVGGTVVAVSRDSMLELEWKEGFLPMTGRSTISKTEPRYVIIALNQGHAVVWRLTPADTATLLEEAGITMPEASGRGDSPYEVTAIGKERGRAMMMWTLILAAAGGIGFSIRRRVKKKRSRSAAALPA